MKKKQKWLEPDSDFLSHDDEDTEASLLTHMSEITTETLEMPADTKDGEQQAEGSQQKESIFLSCYALLCCMNKLERNGKKMDKEISHNNKIIHWQKWKKYT